MNSEISNRSKNVKSTTAKLAICTFAWLITFAAVSLGPELLWPSNQVITVIALLLNIVAGIAMIYANRAHILSLDELEQRIQLNAMSTTLGIGLISVPVWNILAKLNAFNAGTSLGALLVLMSLTYVAAIVFGNSKYK